MDDWRSFLKIYGSIMGVTILVAMSKSKTLLIIYAIVVLVVLVIASFFGGGGGSDGGRDGANY
jgi:hypothetical protein